MTFIIWFRLCSHGCSGMAHMVTHKFVGVFGSHRLGKKMPIKYVQNIAEIMDQL